MTNGIKEKPPAVALYDFYKTNGLDRSVHEVAPGGPSLTRQEFRDECDINTIMARYDGFLADPMRQVRDPVYYDFTTMPNNLLDAMDVMAKGMAAFMTLPATVRREFDNDAAAFVDFASDPVNLPQMRTWGLAAPAVAAPAKPPETAARAVAASPTAPPTASPGAPVAPPAHGST
jgi:hypothetical protein